MTMKVTLTVCPMPVRKTSQDMEIGDICKLVSTTWTGDPLYRTYDGFTSLKNPRITWDNDAELSVEEYPPGTKIEFTIS